MPWTLYRYLLKDLIRLLALTTGLLVVVISMAAAIKPLSQGLLGPLTLVKYVFFMTPTMLGFVIPFAGAFATTLVFTRATAENELTACRASGMSYRMILMPVVLVGLTLTMGLFYLSNWVVPSFYRRTASMVEKDLTQILVREVKEQRPVTLGDLVLYADAADDSQPPPVDPDGQHQASKLIRLRGVAVGRLDPTGRLRSDSTAERADLLLYPVDDDVWVTVGLENVMYHDAMRGDLVFLEKWVVPGVRLPQPFRDKPRFLSWPQLRQLARQPERYDQVRQKKRELADAIATEVTLGQLQAALDGSRSNRPAATLLGSIPGERFTIVSPRVSRVGETLQLSSDEVMPVRLDYTRHGLMVRRIEARQGSLQVEVTETSPEPWVTIDLTDAQVYDASLQGHPTERAAMPSLRSQWPTAVLEPIRALTVDQLLEQGTRQDAPPPVAVAVDRLRDKIRYLFRTVVAQLHERAALAVACLLVLLLSAVLSMKLNASMPLVVYFWSFLPAVVVVIVIHSGQNLAANIDASRAAGLGLLWSGNLVLVVAIGTLYWRLSRH